MIQKLKKLAQSNAFVSLAGNGTGALLGIATLAIQARGLSKNDFGTWFIFITTFSLFEVIRSGLILNPVIRKMAGTQSEAEKERVAGAAWQLTTIFTLAAIVLFTIPGLVFYARFVAWDMAYFVNWFWLLSIITLPQNLATWFLNASGGFKKLQWVRLSSQLLFLGFNIANYQLNLGIGFVFWGFIISQSVTALWVLAMGWSRLRDFAKGQIAQRKELFSFGKFSMFTLLFSNLLRSSDTYIIGMVLGPAAVGLYTVPQRLLQIFELPISAISITRLPILAGLSTAGKQEELTKEFERSVGILWMAILPVAILCFVFAKPLVVLLGGEGFAQSASVLRFFCVYAAFLPLERYSGIGLDVVNKPGLNLIKVIIMFLINVAGDFAAIYLFPQAPVAAVAAISVITFGSGVAIGYYLLGRYLNFSFAGIVRSGLNGLISGISHLKK